MPELDDQAQFDAINQPDYFNKLKAKVNAIRSAMVTNEAEAPEIRTRVEGVPVVVMFVSPNEGRLIVGSTANDDKPYLYDWTFPVKWLDSPPE